MGEFRLSHYLTSFFSADIAFDLRRASNAIAREVRRCASTISLYSSSVIILTTFLFFLYMRIIAGGTDKWRGAKRTFETL